MTSFICQQTRFKQPWVEPAVGLEKLPHGFKRIKIIFKSQIFEIRRVHHARSTCLTGQLSFYYHTCQLQSRPSLPDILL